MTIKYRTFRDSSFFEEWQETEPKPTILSVIPIAVSHVTADENAGKIHRTHTNYGVFVTYHEGE